ncbi:hypothetical protein IWQ60_005510 [Tieghemiomyces parasiticus]|uniref:Uncharacterized protein n=1 Tax=Tieghemiomyces parasiticus TaxID=78921 RepID=A0A9W8A5Z4_9FUNG|nr:hypothetical protein IWQ60_005510 [Tieghemiomyces parasiticus]
MTNSLATEVASLDAFTQSALTPQATFGRDASRRARLVHADRAPGTHLHTVVYRFPVTAEDANDQGVMDEAALARLNDDLSSIAMHWLQDPADATSVSTTMTTQMAELPPIGVSIDLAITVVGYQGAFLYTTTQVRTVPDGAAEPPRTLGHLTHSKFAPGRVPHSKL